METRKRKKVFVCSICKRPKFLENLSGKSSEEIKFCKNCEKKLIAMINDDK